MGVLNIITFLFQDNLSAEWQEKIHVAARDVKQFFFFFFLFEADFIQLVVLNLSHLNYIKLCLFLTSNKR